MTMQSLSGTPVLVTGVTGFVGSRLAEQLTVKEKAEVTGLGRNLDRVARLKEIGIRMEQVDLLDTEALKGAVEGKEVVFHTAAVLDAKPQKAQAVNVDATQTLVRLAAEAGVSRFVHVSTVGVYDMDGISKVDESVPLVPGHTSTYPRTKAQAEQVAIKEAESHDLELAIARPSMIYGPGHGVWTEMMFNNVLEGNPVYLGDGSAHFNPVYIDDVVDALIRCATYPDAAGEAFNISAEVTSWREFMSYYGDLCNKEPKGLPLWIARLMALANKIPGVHTPIDQGFIEMANSHKYFLIDKAREVLEWEPKVPLEEGMKRNIAWIREELYTED